MGVIDFVRRLESKDFFREFKKENPDIYICAIFCILNKEETEGDQINVDYFIPSKKKIAYSQSPFTEMLLSEEEGKEYSNLGDLTRIKIDLEDLWIMLEDVKKERSITHNTGKIIGVLTKDNWNLTCLSPNMELLKIKLDPRTKQTISTHKENLSDMIRIDKKNDLQKS
jgi:hypothetical protein